jgi:hypothetical protein
MSRKKRSGANSNLLSTRQTMFGAATKRVIDAFRGCIKGFNQLLFGGY